MSYGATYLLPAVIFILLTSCESDDISGQPTAPPISQEHNLRWQKSLGSTRYAEFPTIQQTSDGGHIMAAIINSSDGSEHGDVWLIKIDSSGAISWERSLGGSASDIPQMLLQVNDGGYLLGAVSNSADGDVGSNNGSSDWWIVRLNSEGNIIWESSLGGSLQENPGAAIQEGNEFIIAGSTSSSDGDVGNKTSTSRDLWMVRMNDSGEILWEKTFGDDILDEGAVDIYGTSDNGYLVAGDASQDIWLVKFDTDFNLIWDKRFGGSQLDYLSSTALTENGIILAVTTASSDGDITDNFGASDIWLVEVNEEGEILWESSYGGSGNEHAAGIVVTDDNGYWVSGSSVSADGNLTNNKGGLDYWVLKLDSSGNILWQQTYGGSLWDKANTAAVAGTNGVLVAGVSASRDGDIQQYIGQVFIWLTMIE